MDGAWLRPKDAAKYAGVGQRTLYAWLKGGLRRTKVGGVTVIKTDWIDAFLSAHEVTEDDGRAVDRLVDEICGDF